MKELSMISMDRKKALFAGGVASVVTAAAVVMSPVSSLSPFKPECPPGHAMAPYGNVQLAAVCWATPTTPPPPPPPSGSCDLVATPATFVSQLAASVSGQTLCLTAGSYGTFFGTNKAIVIRSQTGQTASMVVNVGSGDTGFTLQSMTIGTTDIANGATNITFRDSTFVGKAHIGVQNANILFDNNTHNNMDGGLACAGCDPARIQVFPAAGDTIPSGVTVRNSYFSGGDADGFWTTVGVTLEDNEFVDICSGATGNHTDNIQVGINLTVGIIMRRNFVHQTDPANCDAQSVSAFDELKNATIVDNVINHDRRPWGLQVFSDDTSTIAHNTVVGNVGNPTSCNFTLPCGWIELNAKDTDDDGFGTIIKDNIAYRITFSGGSTAGQQDHNMVQTATGKVAADFVGTPVYVGGADPATYEGYCLAVGSPGENAASDGLDVGIRC